MDPVQNNICARCHQEGQGCCVLAPTGSEQMFGLTNREIRTICEATGMNERDFVTADIIDQGFHDLLASINPLFLKTVPGGRRLRLRTRGRACCFLGKCGCRLPVEARPFYCRLYPFCFTPDGLLMVLLSNSCLAQEGARHWREVLGRLGDSEENLRRLWAELEQAAAEHRFN